MGKTLTIAERARRAGLDPRVVYQRINKYGWSEKLALSTPVSRPATTQKFLARMVGISPAAIGYRLRHGLPVMAPKKEYPLAHSAGEAGIDRQRVWARVKSGWSLDMALSTPIIAKAPRSTKRDAVKGRIYAAKCKAMVSALLGHPVTRDEAWRFMRDLRRVGIDPMGGRWNGVATVKEKAVAAGINPAIVRQRVKRNGWSLERALATPVEHRSDTLTHRARAAGLPPILVWQRIRRDGWSEERALSTPPLR